MLEDVVGSAEAAEVAAAGQSAVVLGGGVVEVAAPGGLTAAGEPAGQVPGGDVFLEPRRGPVGGAGRRVRAAVRGGISGHGSPGTGHGSRGGPQCPGQDPIRRVRACSRSRRGGRRVSQDVLGNGQGDAANQPYRGARSGPGVRPCPGAGSCRGAGFLPGVWSWRVVMAAGYAGDGEGVAAGGGGGGGDDDPPFGAGVAGGGPGEAAGLCGGDGADPAEVARAGAIPGEYLPGQGYVEEPGDGAAVGDPGAGAGEGGRDQRGQIRPVRRQPPIIVMLGVDVSGVAGRAVTGDTSSCSASMYPAWPAGPSPGQGSSSRGASWSPGGGTSPAGSSCGGLPCGRLPPGECGPPAGSSPGSPSGSPAGLAPGSS